MKKWTAMILAGFCTMSLLTGCGDGKEGQNGKETDTTQTDAAQDYKALEIGRAHV